MQYQRKDNMKIINKLVVAMASAAGLLANAGYDAAANPIPIRLRAAGPSPLVDSGSRPTVVAAVLFNGIWSKPPEGEWVKKGRDEVPKATTNEKNFKYAVHIVGALNDPLPLLPEQSCRAAHAQEQGDQGGCDLRAQVI